MKKNVVFFAFCLVGAITLSSCASAPKVKDVSGPTEIIEHKGTAFGVAQPEWVGTVLGTPNQKTLSKALGIDKHIWVVSKTGENLDFVKTWADQVDARAEIGASIKQGISDFVGARADGDKSDVEETVERYSARASAVTVIVRLRSAFLSSTQLTKVYPLLGSAINSTCVSFLYFPPAGDKVMSPLFSGSTVVVIV
jgi:hypothetical protein